MLDLPNRISEWLLQLVGSQRALAHVCVDSDQVLVDAGGHLEHYGLTVLERGRPACDQLPFLEGLLPLPESPFLLRSLEMSGGRVADVHFFAGEDVTWIVFLDVTAEHGEARKTQQKAYDMTLLSQREARLRAELQAAHEELTAAHHELAASREALLVTHTRLQRELRDAERYVRAILPAPMTEPVTVDWLFVPCTELGGDSFGYHLVDAEHLALYLLDVCGHGVGSALLSVAVTNTLRSGALPSTDFRMPQDVLRTLNDAYQMRDHGELYFTIWYGVYHWPTRRLRYASAGHPPAMLVNGTPERPTGSQPLRTAGPPVGMSRRARYGAEQCTLSSPARLFLFSDGVYEVSGADGTVLDWRGFEQVLTRAVPNGESDLDGLLRFARERRGEHVLEDDFSVVRMTV